MALQMFHLIVALSSLILSPPKPSLASPGFKAMLKHVDHDSTLSSAELFMRSAQRSKRRLQENNINDRIHSLDGEFLIDLSIGTPPVSYSAIIDTNTDLTWTTCKSKPCDDNKNDKECSSSQLIPSPVLDPSKSSSYSQLLCFDTLCKQARNSSCNTRSDGCSYEYRYSDDDSIWARGDLATETFKFFNGNSLLTNIAFGCAKAMGNDTKALGSGFVGLGRGVMSLVSQMKVTNFSFCFPSYDYPSQPGMLAFGSGVEIKPRNSSETITADIVPNPSRASSSYYVSLKGIKVNGSALNVDNSTFGIDANGKGGTIIDSRLAFSYIDARAYGVLKAKLVGLIKLKPASDSEVSDIGLDLCYGITSDQLTSSENYFPKIAFTLGDGKGQEADLVLSNGNAFRTYDVGNGRHVACLAMAASTVSDAVTRLGNIQMQNTLVVYDLVGNKVSFLPNAQCDKL